MKYGDEKAKSVADEFFAHLAEKGILPTPEQRKKISDRITGVINYHPTVGVFGKTGAGKSSLCNALFGQDIAHVSDVEACTRHPQEILLQLGGGKGITLLDVPGVGESRERDKEYSALYRELLPKLDLVLWVLKGDDRAFSIDEHFYNEIVLPHLKASKTPIVFVLNQVDKIEPLREWNIASRSPGSKQAENIAAKLNSVSAVFDVAPSSVCAVSAEEDYGLVELVERITVCLPAGKKYGFVKEAREEKVSEKTKAEAEKGIWESIKEVAIDVIKTVTVVLVKEGLEWLRSLWK